MENLNVVVSKYHSVISTSAEPVNLFSELTAISDGKYKTEVMACRKLYEQGNSIAYKKNKAQLPAVTFSGQFNGSHKKENLSSYSNFIVIDVDALNKGTIESVKEKLFSDKYVAAIWISPSGCGLKILIKVSSVVDNHKKCFDTISNYLFENYSVEIDKSGSDVCRLCFVSYDEKLLLRENFSLFDYTMFFKETFDESIKAEKKFTSTQLKSEKEIFHGTQNKNVARNRDTIIKIIKYLRKNKLSITGNYSNWFRVACAIANSFTYQLGQRYYLELCRLDAELHDEYKSHYLLEYCYRNRKIGLIDFSTIVYLAKEKGFEVKSKIQ